VTALLRGDGTNTVVVAQDTINVVALKCAMPISETINVDTQFTTIGDTQRIIDEGTHGTTNGGIE
jgi:hypothetical protein